MSKQAPAIDFSKPNSALTTPEPPAPAPKPTANTNTPAAPVAAVVVQEQLTLISSRIPTDLHHRMKIFCVSQRIDMKDFITAAIAEKLDAAARTA